jgi:hypothetical protein
MRLYLQDANGTPYQPSASEIPSGSRLLTAAQYVAADQTARIWDSVNSAWLNYTSTTSFDAFTAWPSSKVWIGAGHAGVPADGMLGGGLYALLVARGLHEPSDFTEWLPS